MSSTTATTGHDEHEEHAGDGAAEHHGFTDKQYVFVAMGLAALTAIEVTLSYLHGLGAASTVALFIIMAIKFVLVVLFFMHLKFDNKLFGMLFWSGLILAIGVYAVALSTFQLFAR
jgi:cytochrome c oxidase subunit IV